MFILPYSIHSVNDFFCFNNAMSAYFIATRYIWRVYIMLSLLFYIPSAFNL